jgi:hypothetical protein
MIKLINGVYSEKNNDFSLNKPPEILTFFRVASPPHGLLGCALTGKYLGEFSRGRCVIPTN